MARANRRSVGCSILRISRQCVVSVVSAVFLLNIAPSNGVTVAKPSATQAKWLDYEIGASIHFNMQTFNGSMKPGQVVPPDTFNPMLLSTDQWVAAAASFGARYVVLTLDHFSGFLLWPTNTNYNYSVKNSRWRNGTGDIAWEFMESCKKRNIEYGFYFSVHENWFMDVNNFKTKNPEKQRIYQSLVEQQMIELFNPDSKYKNPFYIWFDGGVVEGVSPNVGPIIRTLAENSICDECQTFSGNQGLRWVGNEYAVAPLPHWYPVPDGKCNMKTREGHIISGDPLGKQFCPSSCDTVIREHFWFWRPNTENRVKNVSTLVKEYMTSVGRGCNMILNLNPDPSGMIPSEDVQAYKGFGEAISLLYRDLVTRDDDPELKVGMQKIWELKDFLTVKNGSVVLMEDVARLGQLVESYDLQFDTSKGWVESTDKGSTIGHKRIHPFPSDIAGEILYGIGLNIKKLVTNETSIVLRQMSVYDWSEANNKGII